MYCVVTTHPEFKSHFNTSVETFELKVEEYYSISSSLAFSERNSEAFFQMQNQSSFKIILKMLRNILNLTPRKEHPVEDILFSMAVQMGNMIWI